MRYKLQTITYNPVETIELFYGFFNYYVNSILSFILVGNNN
ncbi:hypothetical protein FM106_09100 [Brachybacterium faecium]|nr:hypothetical protein FM106_09100 [Brachybacterium faecium]